MSTMPQWQIPKDLQERLDSDDDGIWEDDRWHPVLLTVMRGTTYGGRDIPLAWQIEFEPADELFDAANQKIQELGAESDGYGWANVLNTAVAEHHPEVVDELHFGDTETDCCVVWVESENTCRLLMQVIWGLTHGS